MNEERTMRGVLRALGAVMIGGAAIAVCSAIVSLMRSHDVDVPARFLLFGLIVTGTSALLIGLLSTARRPGPVRVICFVTAPLVLIAAASWTWLLWAPDDWLFLIRVAGTTTMLSVTATLSVLIASLESRSRTLATLRWTPLVMAWTANASGLSLIWFAAEIELLTSTTFVQMLAVGSVMLAAFSLAGCLMVMSAIRSVERRRVARHESLPKRVTIDMTCPRCAAEGTFRSGLARCDACGFAVVIELEEPRCACGFLLYQLAGTTCPECGRPRPDRHPASGN